MENQNKVYQGQTLGITITLDEPADGELALGIYGQNATDKIVLTSKNGLEKIDNTHYTATVPNHVTRQMRAGVYTVEMLYKTAGGKFVAISEKVLPIIIVPSRIGKECL